MHVIEKSYSSFDTYRTSGHLISFFSLLLKFVFPSNSLGFAHLCLAQQFDLSEDFTLIVCLLHNHTCIPTSPLKKI